MDAGPVVEHSELLLIGGRSGVGKTSLAAELHHQLSEQRVRHAVIEGDNLDLAYPPPWAHGLAQQNLRALWSNYRALGYRRLIYTNTVSVLQAAELAQAMQDAPSITAVLLTCSEATVRRRLEQRETGAGLELHLERSLRRAAQLESEAPAWVRRIATDDQPLSGLAAEVLALLGWAAP
ncbi:ATPase [Deinococcus irradiatisoli]|uniref:ATPase n=1 Tax=Deinococcus irradiatisoli TaxID=2202254 RepID=A0A2Z3JKW4_9DEIO|nr:AAA family ATPase [Deinococcus irradiatisoli]AWN23930.1 ATPase [Deinococcus irradiatisoli]